MNKKFIACSFALAIMFALFASPSTLKAGTIILEGSDAIGFHCPLGEVGACTYADQVWSAIGGSSSLPIAVFGNTVTGAPVTSGTHPVSDFSSVAAAGSLSNYVALYFLAVNGCCTEDDSLITAPGAATAVSSYLAGGGTVMIENYNGGSAWDFAVGAGGNGFNNVAGVGGALGGPGCTDGETVTPLGITNGFTQPPAIGCWTHQAYNEAFFGPLGFTLSFFDADPAFAASNPGVAGPFSSLLSSGVTVTGSTPEPSSIVLLSTVALAGLGFKFRRRFAKS